MIATPSASSMPTTTTATSFPSCSTAVPDKNGWVPLEACNSLYPYNPNFPAECAFALLFGLTTTVHLVQAIAWKKSFCWALLVGASWEFLAFLMRAIGARNQQDVGYVIPGQLLFLLAPLWINAFVYMTVARLVYFALSDRQVFKIKATMLTRTFVLIDIICFLAQAAGGGMMSNTDTSPDDPVVDIGQRVYMGGCGAQLGFVLLFCGITARLHMKARRERNTKIPIKRVRILIWIQFAVLVMIIIRVVFRLVEFSPGQDDHLSTNEVYALVLDALPMLLALLLLNVMHPGSVLRGPGSEFEHIEKNRGKVRTQEHIEDGFETT